MSLVLCLFYAYRTLTDFGLSVAESVQSATIWLRIFSFAPFLTAFQFQYALFFTEKRAVVRSKGFFLLVYGWAAVLSGLGVFTDLLRGDIVQEGESWIVKSPSEPGFFYFLGYSSIAILAITILLLVIYVLHVHDEIRRAQALDLTIGILILATVAQYLAGLGLFLVVYGVARYGVTSLTPKLSVDVVMKRLPDLLLFVNPHGKVQFANDAACQALKYSRDQITGLPFERISSQHPATLVGTDSFGKLKSAGQARNIELTFKSSEGQQVPFMMSIAEVRNLEGRLRGYLYLGRDLRYFRKREADWAKSQQELELDSIAKADFMGTVSTEITIAAENILETATELLESTGEVLTAAQHRGVDKIAELASRIKNTCREVQEITSRGQDFYALHRQDFLFRPMLEETLNLFSERAQVQDIMLVFDTKDDLGSINADRRMITQVVYNLLNNAVQFTPAGGRVELRARRIGEGVEVTISDTGIGIDQKDLDKLFHAYKTLRTPSSKKYEGKGLGLFYSKQFVTLHGGRIWAESQLGNGSRFHFTIPANVDLKREKEN